MVSRAVAPDSFDAGVSAEPDDVAGAIARWLLGSAIQLPRGEHRGAVAGWLDADGRPSFAYGEITGYFLSWLAFASAAHRSPRSVGTDTDLSQRAASAARWLARGECEAHLRVARIPIAVSRDEDWRDHVGFTFDLAMIWRGVEHAQAWLGLRLAGLERALRAQLEARCERDGLRACWSLDPASPPPERWSTRPGPYQLKIAAVLLLSPRSTEPMRRSACATLARWRAAGSPAPDALLHPYLYFLEGWTALALAGYPGFAPAAAGRLFGEVMNHQARDGSLPGRLGSCCGERGRPERERADVLAQALRLGATMIAAGWLDLRDWEARLDRLERRLRSCIASDGAVLFHPRGESPVNRNSWCSMFASQAVAFHERVRAGQPLPREWLALLV